MNKRIRLKHEKYSNLKRQNDILNKISKVFTIKSKEFCNGYFLFYHGIDSVCYFTLKQTPEWKYGIWLLENNKFSIFGEHIKLIDKFKPSRGYVSFDDNIEGFIEKVKNIANNPKLYFVDSLTYGNAIVDFQKNKYESYIGYQVKSEYNEVSKEWDIITRDTSITQEQFVERKYNEFMEKEKEEYYE